MHGERVGGGREQSPNQRGSFSIQRFGLVPNVSLQGSLLGHPLAAAPRLRCSLQEQQAAFPPRAGDFWGSRAALHRLGNQPHVPTLSCPAVSRIPNPSHMVSISLGSAGACSAVSKLTFPCLSMQLLARDARPSPRPWSSPTLPVRTRLSQPQGGCREAEAGSCLCSALKLQPGCASGRSVPGEVPAPACLLFPRLCRRSALHPGAFSAGMCPPAGWCRGRPRNATLSPQNAPRHHRSRVWARCHAKPLGLARLGCSGWFSRAVQVVLDLSGLS